MHPLIAEDLSAILEATDVALQKFSGATVLVAGGAGFLPSYIVDSLAFANERSALPRSCLHARGTSFRGGDGQRRCGGSDDRDRFRRRSRLGLA